MIRQIPSKQHQTTWSNDSLRCGALQGWDFKRIATNVWCHPCSKVL